MPQLQPAHPVPPDAGPPPITTKQDSAPLPTPEAPLPSPDSSTVDLRGIPALSVQPLMPSAPSPQTQYDAETGTLQPVTQPARPHGFLGTYQEQPYPPLALNQSARLQPLIRDGKLYLSLQNAIALAIENNLDVQIARYNLVIADSDATRAAGGGSTRGIDFTLSTPPPGLGGPVAPLLSDSDANTAPVMPTISDLSQLQITTPTTQSYSESDAQTFSAGPSVPLYDPNIVMQGGWLRRSDTVSLTPTDTGTSGSGSGANSGSEPNAVNFINLSADYLEGFSTGAQFDASINNVPEVLYGSNSDYNPFHSPSATFTLTQPLLRGFGRGVNLRYLCIAQLDQKASRLLFAQQVLNTIAGVSQLYYNLVSFGEDVGVKQENLAAAQKLYEDDNEQVKLGTLAPLELARVQSLLAASKLALIQSQGEFRQEETILRAQLLRRGSDAYFSAIVPTDHIVVPDASLAQPEDDDIANLIAQALAERPDLAQAELQIKSAEASVKGAHSEALPQLNVYGTVELRGSAEPGYLALGTDGTGVPAPPADLTTGGLRTSTIYAAGVQLTLPIRNRVAQADLIHDVAQLRQMQARTQKLEDQVRTETESAAVALQVAYQAYVAAVQSREYQEQLLDGERDKYSVGESTNYMVVQDEAYLAQARSSEVAARSDWMKARIALDRALGDLLEKNGVQIDDAITGHTIP